jgi:hypothetical protein
MPAGSLSDVEDILYGAAILYAGAAGIFSSPVRESDLP